MFCCDSVVLIGGVLMCDVGIGIWGIGMVFGGGNLKEKYLK